MSPKRVWQLAANLLVLVIIGFLVANIWAGNDSMDKVVEIARSRCIEDGFPAQDMLVQETFLDSGVLGFGGRASVTFSADGRLSRDGKRKMDPLVLRVELGRPMNLSHWEVRRVTHEP